MENENKENTSVSYFIYESAMSRLERTIKRLWILCIILIILFVGTNGAWLYFESQWEDVTTVTQETQWDGDSNVVLNGTGEVTYNERSSEADGN